MRHGDFDFILLDVRSSLVDDERAREESRECMSLGAHRLLFLPCSVFLCHADPEGSNTGLQVSHAPLARNAFTLSAAACTTRVY